MLEDAVVRKVLGAALATGGEWAEVYAEDRLSHNIRLEDRRVEELVTGRDRGAGVRVVKGTASAYAYTNRLDTDALLEAARVAAAALRDRRARDEARLTLVDGARELARALAGGAPVVEVFVDAAALDDEGRAAVGLARKLTPAGGVVLLSPAAPSYGRFRNFEHRSEVFAQAVADTAR